MKNEALYDFVGKVVNRILHFNKDIDLVNELDWELVILDDSSFQAFVTVVSYTI